MIVTIALAASPARSLAQEGGTEKEAPPRQWTDLLSEEEFKALHQLKEEEAPPGRGETVELPDGTKAYLSLPTAGPAGARLPGLVVIHEWWGLNSHIRHWTDRLAAAGYAALAVDLYGGAVATTTDEAMKRMQSVDEEASIATLRAAVRYLRESPYVRADRVGSIGWCFGGGWSLKLAIDDPDLDVAVIYYGRLETDPEVLKKIHARILGIFGNRDRGIPPAVVDAFDEGLTKAGVAHEIHRYEADHAFANPSSARYDAKSAEDAWRKVQAFLGQYLLPPKGETKATVPAVPTIPATPLRPAGPGRAASSGFPSLTPAEQAAGWRFLFDGMGVSEWRGYRKDRFPAQGWVTQDGSLRVLAGGGGGDIITRSQFGDFELSLEWRVSEKANSGIMYRVKETYDAPWQTGPEYQILDDAGAGVEPTAKTSAGALYDLVAPSADKVTRPAGEYNTARIRVQNDRVRHWLNGVKIVDHPIAGDAWNALVAGSKFAQYEGFGSSREGAIALQDHGNEVWFRDIRIRDLSAPMPLEFRLFDGKSLAGWTWVCPDGADVKSVWSVDEGILVCKGTPAGYIRTEKEYTNFVLRLEWRFSPVTKKAGNSGVLLRITGEDKVWPACLEAQLQSGNAGDFWNIGEYDLASDPARTQGRNIKKLRFAENPVGEWNEYEIVVEGGTVTLFINGEEMNRVTGMPEVAGKIGLQSEGAEIHFRNIRLAPLP